MTTARIKALDTVSDSRIDGGKLHAKQEGTASMDAAKELEKFGFVKILGTVKEEKETVISEPMIGVNRSTEEEVAKKQRLKEQAQEKKKVEVPENKMKATHINKTSFNKTSTNKTGPKKSGRKPKELA